MYEINETHDPNLKSWVESANDPNTDFPIQNLPFCSFRASDSPDSDRIGVRIGDSIFDLAAASNKNMFETAEDEFDHYHRFLTYDEQLNLAFEVAGDSMFHRLRAEVSRILNEN